MNDEIGLDEAAPWLVICITLLGGFLRILLLDLKGMWLDETFSVWLTGHNVGEMLQWIVRIDQHPPLYYLLLHNWVAAFGDAPYTVRLLSVLFGTGTIPIIYLIGQRLSGVIVGLIAAVFLAFSPIHIFYAQETRMYTLLTFNVSVAIYALVRLLSDPRSARPIGSQFREFLHTWRAAGPQEPDTQKEFSYKMETRVQNGWRAWISRRRWLSLRAVETDLAWVGLILFSAAALLTHNTAVLFPIAANFFVLGLMLFQKINHSKAQPAFQSPPFGNWIKAQVGILLLWSPWIIPFVKQVRMIEQRFWIPEPTWDAVVQVLKSFLNASAPLPAGLAQAIWILYGLVLLLGLVYFRKKLSQFIFLAGLFAIPILGELLVSIRTPIFSGRTLIWITIPIFLVLAAGVAQFKFQLLVIGLTGIFGFISLFSASDYFRFYQKEDWSTAAGFVANFAEKDDLVLFNSNFVEIPFNYYFSTYEEMYSIQVTKAGVPQDLFESGILEPEMMSSDIPALISLLSGHQRVWLVYSHNSYTDPTGLIPKTLASQMQLIRVRNFYGGQVQLYEIP